MNGDPQNEPQAPQEEPAKKEDGGEAAEGSCGTKGEGSCGG